MKIQRLNLRGFGTFNRGIDIEFPAEHVGMVIGRNEAGKSTIMSAIFGILFGFKDSSLQRKFEPWEEHDEYAGEVEIGDASGTVWRIRRNFVDNTAEIGKVLADGGYEPVFLGSANPRGHGDDDIEYYRRIESIVGFQDEAIFRGTIFVGQNAIQTSITDQIRKLVSGSGSTDFKGALHELHSRFSELTMENPWGKGAKAKPRKIELLRDGLATDEKRLSAARDNFLKTITLEQEQKKLEVKQAENKSALEDYRNTLAQFERFCKLIKDRDAAQERFRDADKRRETYVEQRDKVTEIDRELKSDLARLSRAGDDFPEIVAQLKSESRELEQEEALLGRDRDRLQQLRPMPNNRLGGILAALGLALGAVLFQVVNPAAGGLTMIIVGGGLFFLGRNLATGFKEKRAELESQIDARSRSVRSRQDAIQRLIAGSQGLLGSGSPDQVLADFRKFRALREDRARRIASMRVLGEWPEIDAGHRRAAEENLRCNGLMEIILSDAPYLRELSEDPVAIARSVEELKRRIGELTEEISVMTEVLTEARIALAKATSDVDYDIPAMERQVQERQRQLSRLERDRDSLRIVIDTLDECVTEFQEGDLTKLSEEVSELFRGITGNRYTRVTLSPNMEPMLTKYDNTHIAPTDLSQGTQDQLFFAMRVAIARHLSRRVPLPLFLDDPFVNFDEERLEVTRELLEKLTDHQIVMVTCDRGYEGWTDRVLDLDMARAESMATAGKTPIRLRPRPGLDVSQN